MDTGDELVVQDSKLKLYSYFRSSCSWRVRIALNLKGLKYEYKAVNLLEGEQFSEEFTKLNPIGYVPVLTDDEQDIVISDSFAILLYLEDKYPQHPLLPQDLQKKAINLQAANIVSSSIQPLQNLAVLKYIEEKVSSAEKLTWVQYHIGKGFAALENLLEGYAGKYATGNEVFLYYGDYGWNETRDIFSARVRMSHRQYLTLKADLFLAPQIDAALTRFSLDMTQFPLLSRLHNAYMELPAFQAAVPERQPDYVKR